MKKYTISGLATISCYTTVDAENEEEALEMAAERELAGLCHQPFTDDIENSFHYDGDSMADNLKIESQE